MNTLSLTPIIPIRPMKKVEHSFTGNDGTLWTVMHSNPDSDYSVIWSKEYGAKNICNDELNKLL